MSHAKIYLRKNGEYGASCDGCLDTGHRIEARGGLVDVWSVNDPDRIIAKLANRKEAEKAITEDWRAAK